MGGSVPGGHTDTTAVDFWRWAWVTRETHGSKLRSCLSWIWNGKFRISYTSIFFLFSKCITWIKCVLVIFTPIPSLQLPSDSQHISLTTSCPFKKIITHWVLFVDAHMHIGIDSSTGVWPTYQWIPHNERESPCPSSHQLPIAPQLVVGPWEPFHDQCWIFN